MYTQNEIEKEILELKPILLSRFHVEKIGYFGSFARNEQKDDSDIDIIVSLGKPLGWAFFDLKDLLETKLKRRIDLVTMNALKYQLKDIILKEVKYL